MASFNDKIVIAFNLASQIADRLTVGTLELHENGAMDLVYAHADGLTAKRLYDLRDGHCSLAASISFDPIEEEVRLDTQITAMQAMLI